MAKADYISWGVSGACLAGSFMFPAHAKTIWIAGLALLLPVLWNALREPVNYKSLEFDGDGFVFEPGAGSAVTVKWSEITDVDYCRFFEPFANQIETCWLFHRKSGDPVKVLVEWPHRAKFARAVTTNLRQVSTEAVREAKRQRGEGRWSVVQDKVLA